MKRSNTKNSVVCGLIAICFAAPALAGTATFTGEARIKTEADFVELNITITSECFKTAMTAVADNDAVATQVMEILRNILSRTDVNSKIFATGGYVERYTNYDPNTRRAFCVNTFRKNNLITARVKLTPQFAADFARIQDAVYGLARDPSPEPREAQTTFLQMSQPQTGLNDQRRDELRARAVSLALANAVDKFRATFPLVGIDRYTISSYRESGTVESPGRPSRGADLISAPVQFDELAVTSNVIVEFTY